MRTTYLSDAILNHVYRNTPLTSPTTVYVGLVEAVTDAEAGTVTETAYTGYARQALALGAPSSGGGGRQIQNTGTINFPQKTNAGTNTEIAVGVWDALTVGNLTDVIYLDGGDPIVFSCSDLAGDTIHAAAHGLVNDQRVRVETIPGAPTLPTGLAANTTYFVVGTATDTFQLSATQGGGAINITASGRGKLMRLTPITVNQNDTPQIATSAVRLYDD